METNASLQTIKKNLFHGLLDYTKSFPDFSIPQRFEMVIPREGKEVLHQIERSLNGESQLLIYVHLPFCSSECVFCNAFPQKSSRDIQDRYVENILEETRIYSSARIFKEKSVKCVYLGGGTPTAFRTDQIEQILRELRSVVTFSKDCSITCEAHVKDLLGTDRIAALGEIGVNRISVGCQTFEARVLELCRRFHRDSQVKEVIRDGKRMGLSTNVDMMIGLPGQSVEGVRKDLDILDDIAPDSIEYMRHEIVNPLAISLFRKDPDLLVDDDRLFEMAYQTQTWMEAKGYEQNGSFTSEKPFPYRYYWLKETPFIALGSRSRSYTKDICFDKHEDLSLYFRLIGKGMAPIARYMVLNEREQMCRSLFLNLQIRDGLDLQAFQTRFGEDARQVFSPLLDRLQECGCLEVDDSAIKLSRYGRYFVEDVCCSIIDQALRDGGYDADFKRMPHSSGAFSERRFSRLRGLEGG